MKKYIVLCISVLLGCILFFLSLIYFKIIDNPFVKPIDFSKVTIAMNDEYYEYTGNEIFPIIYVYHQGVQIEKSDNYKIEYFDNKTCGKAKIRISGINKNFGKKEQFFYIVPNSLKSIREKETTSSNVVLTWDLIDEATGYNVYEVNENNKSFVCKTLNNKVKISNLKSGKEYKFFVVPYFSNEQFESLKPASIQITTLPEIPKIIFFNKDKQGYNLIWNYIDADGYEIKYSKTKDFKNTLSVFSEKNSISIPKDYPYIKIRSFINNKNTKIYSSFSKLIGFDFNKKYASYYSYYVNNANRTNNLVLACKQINGTILQPNEIFSFNQIVGERTMAKGYKAAHVFQGRNKTIMGLGGGVCQVASTMFNASLIADFEIVERHQHSQRVTYVPLGQDAAIYWKNTDFKFKNTTDYPIKITAKCKNGKLTITYWITETAPKHKKTSVSVYRYKNSYILNRFTEKKITYRCVSKY